MNCFYFSSHELDMRLKILDVMEGATKNIRYFLFQIQKPTFPDTKAPSNTLQHLPSHTKAPQAPQAHTHPYKQHPPSHTKALTQAPTQSKTNSSTHPPSLQHPPETPSSTLPVKKLIRAPTSRTDNTEITPSNTQAIMKTPNQSHKHPTVSRINTSITEQHQYHRTAPVSRTNILYHEILTQYSPLFDTELQQKSHC